MGVIITVGHKSRPPVTDILGFFKMKMGSRQGGWKQHGVVIIARFVNPLLYEPATNIWQFGMGDTRNAKYLIFYSIKIQFRKKFGVWWALFSNDTHLASRSQHPPQALFSQHIWKSLDKLKADCNKITPKCCLQCEIVDIRNPITKGDFITSDPLFQ